MNEEQRSKYQLLLNLLTSANVRSTVTPDTVEGEYNGNYSCDGLLHSMR